MCEECLKTMIIVEMINESVERRYSNQGVKIRQVETNTLWNDAVNAIPCRFTYEETEEPIDSEPLDPQDALDIIFGGAE